MAFSSSINTVSSREDRNGVREWLAVVAVAMGGRRSGLAALTSFAVWSARDGWN
jgi:hypothetical protein